MMDKEQKNYSVKNHKGVILLTSNSKKINSYLMNRLSSYGYKVIVANNGFDTLDKLRSVTIDLIITRLNFRGMDCLELMMYLKDFNIDIPVIIIEEKDDKEGDKSLSIMDIFGYCCTPTLKAKISESISLITSKQTD